MPHRQARYFLWYFLVQDTRIWFCLRDTREVIRITCIMVSMVSSQHLGADVGDKVRTQVIYILFIAYLSSRPLLLCVIMICRRICRYAYQADADCKKGIEIAKAHHRRLPSDEISAYESLYMDAPLYGWNGGLVEGLIWVMRCSIECTVSRDHHDRALRKVCHSACSRQLVATIASNTLVESGHQDAQQR